MYFATMASTFSYLWLGWLLLFLIIELTAVFVQRRNKRLGLENDGTLSALVWRMTKANRLFFIALSALWVVLAIHFFYTRP